MNEATGYMKSEIAKSPGNNQDNGDNVQEISHVVCVYINTIKIMP